MSTKPISNAPEQMQKWSRWVDKQIEELGEGAIPAIKAKLAKMDANDIRYQQTIAQLQYQIEYLSDTIRGAASFAGLQATLNGSPGITTIYAPTPTEPTQQTVTFTASGSASWAGNNLITGTGTYTDAKMMYQGPAAGSQKTASFWFSQSDLDKVSGKTILSIQIYVKNRHFYFNSGGTVNFGTHGYQSATRPTSRTNPFEAVFSYGEGKWIDLSSTAYNSIRTAVYNGIAGGSIKGFSIGIDATDDPGDYSYFDGATKTSPPKMKITYNT